MLQDMFPDDQEALDAIAKAGGLSGTVQSDQKADDGTSKLSRPGWDTNYTGTVGGGNISGYKNK